MGGKQLLRNVTLLIVTVILFFFLLNAAVERAGFLGGISLAEFVLDEFRIRVLPLDLKKISLECFNEKYLSPCYVSAYFVPNCTREYHGWMVRLPKSVISINSIGFRGRDYPVEKAQNTYRIFVLGDSVTFGLGVNNDEAYPEILERKLNSLNSTYTFEVWNLGYPGGDPHGEYCLLMKYLNYSPDFVLLQTLESDVFECFLALELESLGGEIIWNATNTGQFGSLPIDEKVSRQFSSLGDEERYSCIRRYLTLMLNKTQELGVPFGVYDESDQYILQPDTVDAGGYYTFQSFENQDEVMWGGRKHRLSREDYHYNAEGNKMLAEELFPWVLFVINETSPGVLSPNLS